jgi:flagellar hook-associated protein 1
MFLGNTLGSAASGLDSISRQLALVSQNVANASTPNYVRQTLTVTSAAAGDQNFGVRTGPAIRNTDDVLHTELLQAVGSESGAQVRQAALERIDQVSGAPGGTQDLPSLLGALRDSFSQLEGDPANGTQQRNVIAKAQALGNGLNTMAAALLSERQNAQDALVQQVASANTALHNLGALSDQIIVGKSRGESTADLEDQRDGQMRNLSQLTGARFAEQSDGDMMVIAGSTVLPTRANSGPFSVGSVTFAGNTPAALVPPLLINGAPGSGMGGQIGANLTLRDTTLPGLQAGLDGFAQGLAAGFSGQGLDLFTDPTGAVPAAGTAGVALSIGVSSAVQAAPTMVRDGASAPGAAGDTTLIDNVLNSVFASGATSLTGQATALVAGHAALASDASSQTDTATALRSGVEAKLGAVTGVSVDSEMSDLIRLQNAYGANAKVVTAVQDMWNQLLGMLR